MAQKATGKSGIILRGMCGEEARENHVEKE